MNTDISGWQMYKHPWAAETKDTENAQPCHRQGYSSGQSSDTDSTVRGDGTVTALMKHFL